MRIPYEPGEVPSQAFLESGNKTIPDFVPINGRMAVCPEVHALMESFEPDVHQFVPVHIRRPRSEKPIFRLDGRVLVEPYYLFHVITFLDSVWVERSDVILSEGTSLIGMKPGNYNIVLHKEITAGHHAWREGRIASTRLLFSDDLTAAINAKGFKKWTHTTSPKNDLRHQSGYRLRHEFGRNRGHGGTPQVTTAPLAASHLPSQPRVPLRPYRV